MRTLELLCATIFLTLVGDVKMMIAQSVEVFGGNAGWFGAGLLGLVLAWLLLRHLPEKDRQIFDFVKAKDLRSDEERKQHTENVKFLIQIFTAEIGKEREVYKESLTIIAQIVGKKSEEPNSE